MTLARQLLVGITIAFISLLLGIEAIYVSTARSYLEKQLNAHANETATSLALSLGARATSLDASVINIMVNPVFDRGHFDFIEVRSTTGETIFGRSLEVKESNVPAWFVTLVALEGPTGEALISSGWKQLGKAVVKVHPGYAYQQLYDTAVATLGWLIALFALALLGMRYHLEGILKPLKEIEDMALAISHRNFVSIGVAPRTRELQRVTDAMNSLSTKIRDVIAQESERAERLRKAAFEDMSTGQLNRRGFEQAVVTSLDETGEIHSGALSLFFIAGLVEINALFGLSRGDAVLKSLAASLTGPGAPAELTIGHWQGPTMAAFTPNISEQSAADWAKVICSEFNGRLRAQGLPESVVLSCGIAAFSEEAVSLKRLAEIAEAALADAGRIGGTVLASVPKGTQVLRPDIRKEIESAIQASRITLLGQKVVSIIDHSIMQLELLCSLIGSDGRSIPAGSFVPIANQHGLLPALDIKVIERAVAALARDNSLPLMISVNVSMQSIGDKHFRSSLVELLAKNQSLAKRITFEVTGYAASRSPELTRSFSAELQRVGGRIALDNFDLDRNAMTIVHDLLPAYIKLSPAFTQQIAVRDDLRFIVEALIRMLQPLEIPLIAQGVEDVASLPVLAELGLAGYQGYALGRPEPLQMQ